MLNIGADNRSTPTFNNTNCNKALHSIKIGKLCQSKMTGFNTQFSAECITLLNLVMVSSSSVQLNDFAGNEDSPTKHARGEEGTKRARNQNSIGDRMEKKPWEKPGSVGGPVPLRPDEPVVCSNCIKVKF